MNAAMLIRLGWRNLWSHYRRSLATLLSLGMGFAALVVFSGYTGAVNNGLAQTAIHAELIGHFSVQHRGWRTQGRLNPDRYLLTPFEIQQVRQVVQEQLPGTRVVERMDTSGLLSNGRNSTIFIAQGLDAEDQRALRGPFAGVTTVQLKPAIADGVVLAEGLSQILDLHQGGHGSVLLSTIHGQANAADVEVLHTVNTSNLATNDKWMLMPLALVRELMDAPGRADALTLVLPAPADAGPQVGVDASGQILNLAAIFQRAPPDEATTHALRERLMQGFAQLGLDLEVATWQEQSTYYRQVRNLYDMIFALMLAVVLSIVVLSIVNAMGMSVVERTREIGTLRAIGLRRTGVLRLFITEALLLVLLGLASGLVLAAAVRWGVNTLDIRYVPPGNSSTVPLYIGFDAMRSLQSGVLLAGLAMAAALLPARRASRQAIPVALGHA